jgi:2'-5' RNA ligase
MRAHAERESYSLWLVPEGDICRRLQRMIRRLSREHSTPCFKPHITLAGSIVGQEREVVARVAMLARELSPLRLRLTHLDSRHEYFRCLFIRVMRVARLIRAHRRAKEIFGLRKRRGFLPHLSLVYGNLPAATKRKIVATLGRRVELEFQVGCLELVSIQGPPSQWRRVKSFRLTKR